MKQTEKRKRGKMGGGGNNMKEEQRAAHLGE